MGISLKETVSSDQICPEGLEFFAKFEPIEEFIPY
jgi:hypothetical protein